ncbi:hypothetical protein CRG98_026384 [Punica granatum]|uniref:Uncharacterized protein n=1 Tax=Punica granatum TaxID=22663 RepID=A0A2I0JAH5_PUNGR|nr:hypothetical protein CRG98_026384 [Punica granatum]
MVALVELDLSFTGITELPNSIACLKKLERLSLMGCLKIKKLPDPLGDLRSLIELDISSAHLIELPDSIGNLEELKVIRMEGCRVRKLPKSVGMMKKLEELHADSSSLEGEMPIEIGMLSAMRILDLSSTNICLLPSTTSQLSSLQILKLHGCRMLGELPILPTSLVSLVFSSSEELGMVPDVSKLTNLTDLSLFIEIKGNSWGQIRPTNKRYSHQSESPNPSRWMRQEWAIKRRMGWIANLHKLERLALHVLNIPSVPAELSTLSQLKNLSLSGPELREIPQLPTNLWCLNLSLLAANTKLPCLSNLKQLTHLRFLLCAITEDGFESLGIGELEQLECLKVANDKTDLTGLRLPVNLRRLYITECRHVKLLPNISHLKNLKVLCSKDCKELTEIPGLAELEPPPKVSIDSCDSLKLLNIKT